MMAFNSTFNPAQLLTQASATPLKPDGCMEMNAEALRFLAAGNPLFGGQFPFGAAGGVPGTSPADAFRAMAAQAGLPFPVMYPGLQPEMKPEMMQVGGGPIPSFVFDVMNPYHPYAAGLDGARRKNATRETTAPLKAWLTDHRKNPYPTKGEKVMLAVMTKMTLTQVSTWFANARRRLKKENKMTWSPQNRRGDDPDDDDLADIDAISGIDGIDRPSSSMSDLSEKKDEVPSTPGTNNNLKDGSDVSTPKKAPGKSGRSLTPSANCLIRRKLKMKPEARRRTLRTATRILWQRHNYSECLHCRIFNSRLRCWLQWPDRAGCLRCRF